MAMASSFPVNVDCSAAFLAKGIGSLPCFENSWQDSAAMHGLRAALAQDLPDRRKLGRHVRSADLAKEGRQMDTASLSLRLRGGASVVEKKRAKSGAQILTQAESLYKTAVSGPSEKDATIWSCLFAAVAFVMGSTDDRVLRRDEKLEDAGDLFTQASNKFKLERKWKDAGDALIRSGDCYQRHSAMGYEAANKYADAAKLFKKELPEEAVAALERAVVVLEHSPDDNMQRAARIHRDLAELHEVKGRFEAAAGAMQRAAELFEADGATIAAESLEVKLADINVLGGKLAAAARSYEELGSRALQRRRSSGSAPCCASSPKEAMERFSELDMTFAGSSRAEIATALQQTMLDADKDAFTKQVRELGDTLIADKTGVVLMNKIREVVGREGEAGEKLSSAVAQEDDDDLL